MNISYNKLTFVVSRVDVTEARDAERIVRHWLGMDMYHGKRKEQLVKEDEKDSTKLLYAVEFTNRLSRLIKTEEILSKGTNHPLAKVLKELGTEAFLID